MALWPDLLHSHGGTTQPAGGLSGKYNALNFEGLSAASAETLFFWEKAYCFPRNI